MYAALVCPGPSCLRHFDPDFAGLTIAVNRAALWVSADVWAANDKPLVDAMHKDVRGNPRLWTNKDTLAALCRTSNRFAASGHAFADLLCPVPAWHLYTAPAALVVAAHLGAKAISVYGADWTDEPDADGQAPPGCRRNADRWAQEREIWDGLVDWLAGRAVSVERLV